jgi:Tfp pilus assembly protein PilO
MNTITSWKTAIGIIISIFLAGVVSIVSANSYIDTQTEKKYYPISRAYALEEKVENSVSDSKKQTVKLDDIQKKQIEILEQVANINGKLDVIAKPNKR